MYALLVFVERYTEDGLTPRSSLRTSEMSSITSPLQSKSSAAPSSVSRTNLTEVPHESLGLPTSTPMISRKSADSGANVCGLFVTRPLPRSQGNSEEDRERGDLSLVIGQTSCCLPWSFNLFRLHR